MSITPGARSLEVEVVVQAIVRVPPFTTVDRESDANEQLTLVQLSPVVLKLDEETKSVPAFIACRGGWYMRDVGSGHLRNGSMWSAWLQCRSKGDSLLPMIQSESDSDPFLKSDVSYDCRALQAQRTVDRLELRSLHNDVLADQSVPRIRREITPNSRYSTPSLKLNIARIIDRSSRGVLLCSELDKVGCVCICFCFRLGKVRVGIGSFRYGGRLRVLQEENHIIELAARCVVAVCESDRLGSLLAEGSALARRR